MERDLFVEILDPLVLAMRAEFDLPTWNAYYRALSDVPLSLLAATVDAMLREAREFFPKAGELRAACERQRRLLLAVHRYEGCIDCEDSKGWRAVMVDGVARVQKCDCIDRYKAKLASLGLDTAVAGLPDDGGAQEVQAFPTIDQLPAPVQERLRLVSAQKVLR